MNNYNSEHHATVSGREMATRGSMEGGGLDIDLLRSVSGVERALWRIRWSMSLQVNGSIT
jgi:hypothetical protein